MQYILMIHNDESSWVDLTEAEAGEIISRYRSFTDEVIASKKLVSGERLHPSHTSTTVSVRNGETLLTDGPFTETKEQLGGFYIVNADDLDDAIKIAAKIPGAQSGHIEVRPVWTE